MDDLIYLDNASTSFPKPPPMYDRMIDFYRTCGVNPGRGGTDQALEAERMILGTRKKLTALFCGNGAAKAKDPNRLVFTPNATAALNLVLKGTVGPGDHVATTHVEHNSVIRPVNHLVRLGSKATFVEPDPEGSIRPDAVRAAMTPETKLVIVNHASNINGVVQDIAAIGAVCREAEVPFCVDAAQTAGVIPIDMAASNVSFLVFTGHKGLMGPTGTGGICVADDAHIDGTLWGGTGVRSAHPFHLDEYPFRLEAGTLNLLGIAGLSAGCDWLLEEGIESIHGREMKLLRMLQDGLTEIRGVTIHGPTRLDRRVAICAITVDGCDPGKVGSLLDVDHDIQTRTGLQCAPLMHEHLGTAPQGTVRFSIGPFNTKEHIEKAIRAVAEIAAQA